MKKFRLFLIFCVILFILTDLFKINVYAEDTYISDEYIGYCIKIGEQYDIEPELLVSIIEKESNGIPWVFNGNCVGLMQVSTYWNRLRARDLGVTDWYDPYSNILVGTDLLSECYSIYGNWWDALDYYGGWEHSEKGQEYVSSILLRTEELKKEEKIENQKNQPIEKDYYTEWLEFLYETISSL